MNIDLSIIDLSNQNIKLGYLTPAKKTKRKLMYDFKNPW